jgi:hypothetical protein
MAALGVAAIFGFYHGIAYALIVALPAWWLSHLAMLGRPAGEGPDPAALEWYPVGRLLLWIAGFAALITILTLLSVSADPLVIAAAMKRSVMRVLAMHRLQADESVIDTAAAMAPALIATGPLVMLTINLWLASRITATSGRLKRPWPDLKATALPPMTLVVLCVAVAFAFTGGLFALIAKISVGALLSAYMLTGFAVVHTLTLAMKNRALWLTCIYAITILFVWPLLSMVALGLADSLFGFRDRFLRTRPPPLPTS